MPGLASVSLHEARDAEDRRLLETGQLALLVEGYYGTIIDRCRARIREQDALDVAAEVAVRLLHELKTRTAPYPVPFRVVVHQVIGWKIREHYVASAGGEQALDDELAALLEAPDAYEELLGRLDFEALLGGLSELERDVLRRRWLLGLEIDEIAAALGRRRNAIDQIIHRGCRKLRERVEAP